MTKTREIEAFPLVWPDGWDRTPGHLRKDGGSAEAMAELNEAREDAVRALGG
jgi:hypothetical protein